MTLTQILQKLKSVFYTKSDLDSMGGGASLDTTIRSKANASDLNNYLPLSGGQLTESVIARNTSDSAIHILGGLDWSHGASLNLYGVNGVDSESKPAYGEFRIDAHNGTMFSRLRGTPDGSLTWDDKNVNVITEYTNNRFSNGASHGYITFSNGFVVAWTFVGGESNTIVVNKPRPFKTIKCIVPDDASSPNVIVSHAWNSEKTTNTTETIYKSVTGGEGFDVVWLGQVV